MINTLRDLFFFKVPISELYCSCFLKFESIYYLLSDEKYLLNISHNVGDVECIVDMGSLIHSCLI